MNRLKDVLLIVLVLSAIYLSSQIWFEFPHSIGMNEEVEVTEDYSNINIWKVVKPNEYMISQNNKKAYIKLNNEDEIWDLILGELARCLNNFETTNHSLLVGECFPENYLVCKFKNRISGEIFFDGLNVDREKVTTRLNYVYKIAIDLDNPDDIYIYNGDSTVVILKSEFKGIDVISSMEEDLNQRNNAVDVCEINGASYDIFHVNTNTMLNPVFVKAEFNVANLVYLDSIVKKFFGSDYDYVRRRMEQNGNANFVYKNEKVLRITSEGMFDFFDANIDLGENTSMYDSLQAAIGFSNTFVNLPDDFYLVSIDPIQKDGLQGYKFSFTYKIYDKLVLFSRIRDNVPLEVEVLDGKVKTYKRLFRDADSSLSEYAGDEIILTLPEILEKNIKFENEEEDNSLKILDERMLKNIDEVYLAYFDRAQKADKQQLIAVWVIDVDEETYIFNAITGSLLEQW